MTMTDQVTAAMQAEIHALRSAIQTRDEKIATLKAGAFTIKPLEWEEVSDNSHEAMTRFISYRIYRDVDKKYNIFSSTKITPEICDTLDEAKSAAQSHWEERVKSCLEPV